jgi:hypothetical protein
MEFSSEVSYVFLRNIHVILYMYRSHVSQRIILGTICRSELATATVFAGNFCYPLVA